MTSSSLPNVADAVIIGGGVIGCAIQYHLAQLGIPNTVLLERDVLGSGSTGRSQAICRMHYSNRITTQLAWQSLQVFANFDARVGGNSGFVQTGYLVVVNEADQGGLERNVAMHQELGVPASVVSPDDPLPPGPHGHAVRRRARRLGAGIRLRRPVSGYRVLRRPFPRSRRSHCPPATRRRASETDSGRVQAVLTAGGERIATDTVVVAAGPWSKRVLAGVGVEVPLLPVRHQVATVARPVELVPQPSHGRRHQPVLLLPT